MIRLGLAVLAVSLCAGCSGAADDADDVAVIVEFLTSAGYRAVSSTPIVVQEESIASCMTDAGFEYFVEVAESLAQESDALPDAEYVARYGYGLLEQPEASAEPPSKNAEYVDSLSEAQRAEYFTHLTGTDGTSGLVVESSCVGRARELLVRYREEYQDRVDALATDFAAAVDVDPRVVHAKLEWARCVREEGYGFRDRLEIVRSLLQQYDAATSEEEITAVAQQELELAAIDFACSEAEVRAREIVELEVAEEFAARVEALIPAP